MSKIIDTVIKTKTKGYVWIDTVWVDIVKLTNLLGDALDKAGIGSNDVLGSSFETTVFKSDKNGEVINWENLDKMKCKTKEQAKLNHTEMVKKWINY